MLPLHYLLPIIVTLFITACATTTTEHLVLPGELSGWKLGHKQQDRLTGSTRWEHIQENEYISQWTKLYTIQFYDTKQTDTEVFMNKIKARQMKSCNKTEWKVLNKQADSIMYEWHIKNCKWFKNRHGLVRLIRGKDGIHSVAYTEKTLQIADKTYQEWQKKLLGATLEAGSQ